MQYKKALLTGALQATLISKTAKFLYHRYLGNTSELDILLSENVNAYGVSGASSVLQALFEYDFPFPVASIRAIASRSAVVVEYEEEHILSAETIYFDGRLIREVETSFVESSLAARPKRAVHCAGGAPEAAIRCLRSVRILELGATFLAYDIKRDLAAQAEYLTDSTAAFGFVGKDAIIAAQMKGVEDGVQYLVPFPLLVNADADCISVDFHAVRPKPSDGSKDVGDGAADCTQQRGTDIMYLDLDSNKILRIDTLRHTLSQPEWVRDHFSR